MAAAPLGDTATLGRLSGGASLTWCLELAPGARLASAGLPGERLFSVCAGRIAGTVRGNHIDRPDGHLVLSPPHIPVTLRAVGPADAVVPALLCHHPANSFPLNLSDPHSSPGIEPRAAVYLVGAT